jgi:hypothetical protein
MKHYKKISVRKRQSNKNKSRKQRLWKMKGCAKRGNMSGGCGTCGMSTNNMMMRGGGCGCGVNVMTGGASCANDILAYPNRYNCVNNLAFTGRGGSKKEGFIQDMMMPILGGAGTCNTDNMPSGASYASGAMGPPWTPSPSSWPGVAGVQGSTNYLAYNNYSYPQADRMLINTEAIPFKYGGKSKKSKKNTFRKHMRKYKTNKHKNKRFQKGGLPSLGILTDVKNSWNTLRGNSQLPSPLPFKDQLENQQQQLNM